MKKIISIILLICSVLCFTACRGENPTQKTENVLSEEWTKVDNYNLDKVIETPTFTIDESVEENRTGGIEPFTFFSDGMVLQRNSVNRVFGKSNYNGGVAVEIGGQKYYGTAKDGTFDVYLPPVADGENLTMTIYGETNKVTVKDVCYGEVILFSGQSNMNWRMSDTISNTWPSGTPGKQYLSYYAGNPGYLPNIDLDPDTYFEYVLNESLSAKYVETAEKEITYDSNIRMMLLDSGYVVETAIGKNKEPQTDYVLEKVWQKADNKETILDCSMFAYYFAKNLRAYTNVKVGVIVAAIGGTSTTTWVDRETYNKNKTVFPKLEEDAVTANTTSSCYNTFIAPMIKYKFGSYVWYQGESECMSSTYGDAFSALVNSYRESADNPNMKVLVVGLPQFNSSIAFPKGYNQENYGYADPEIAMIGGAQIIGRANQQKLPSIIDNCAVSVSVNTGEFDDIHPSDKRVISKQAVYSYLTGLYNFINEDILYPVVDRVESVDGDVQIYFNNLGDGLDFRNKGRGFMVSSDGANYKQVEAIKVGDSVYLSATSAGLDEIKYIRYGWLQYPRISRIDAEQYVSVFNSYGLPLDQFEIKVS